VDIIVNGQHYASWDEVPADVRATVSTALPDTNHDGVPDLLQGSGLAGLSTGHVSTSVTRIEVGGRSYTADELPPSIRDSLRMAGLLPAAAAGTAPCAPTQDGQPAGQPAVQPPGGVPVPGPIRPGQVMLDGVPVDTGQGAPGIIPRKKHWWQRG
jgi:hypothetical protein